MNKNQLAYQAGRLLNTNWDRFLSIPTLLFSYNSFQGFSTGKIGVGFFSGGCAAVFGFLALKELAERSSLYLESKEITSKPEKFPLEHAETIVIEDHEGLEKLMSDTEKGHSKEWGTVLKANHDSDRAVIYEVLDHEIAHRTGLIKPIHRELLIANIKKIKMNGHNGMHHYHPKTFADWFGGVNFAISFLDRYTPKNWINLLTFNLPRGPEVIGYNRLHTYIPSNPGKTELVRATPRQITKYLEAA